VALGSTNSPSGRRPIASCVLIFAMARGNWWRSSREQGQDRRPEAHHPRLPSRHL